MRNRFTVADLAYWTGHWNGAAIEDVLSDAAGMGVGL
jgi:hypothetical protein